MDFKGIHLLAELYGCSQSALSDIGSIRTVMVSAAKLTGSSIVSKHFIKLNPGVTGVVVVRESHLSIHTWPEQRYAALDVYTCKSGVDPRTALEAVTTAFQSKDSYTIIIERGVGGGFRVHGPSSEKFWVDSPYRRR